MISKNKKFIIRIVDGMDSINPEQWKLLTKDKHYSPFLEYEFLYSLEKSKAASAETGWYPQHFLLLHGECLVGAAPAYIKSHSMGEFIFDQGLAQSLIDMGKSYYPKLVATLPFTPSPGYRFLTCADYDENIITQAIMDAMKKYRNQLGLASHSLLFVDPKWKTLPHLYPSSNTETGFCKWAHQFYLWENESYSCFDDYLACFKKKQRRNIKRERLSVKNSGIHIKCLNENELNEPTMELMFDFYRNTNMQFGPWAAFFLNREWFIEIGRTWKHRVIIFVAYRENQKKPIAMSFLVRKDNQLIGRYWGTSEDIPNLHFELCYYSPIEFAIRENLKTFDPGMGSVHKTRRGFSSQEFISYHAFSDKEVSRIFSFILPEVNKQEREHIALLNSSIPWRNDTDKRTP